MSQASSCGILCSIMEVTVTLFVAVVLPLASGAFVRVNSDHGLDSPSCLMSEEKFACKTLMYAIDHLNGKSNLTVLVETNAELNGIVVFENVTFFQMNGSFPSSGSSYKRSEVKCLNQSNRSSLVFKNVSKIVISNIILTQCGALDEQTKYEAALLFKNSSDISLVNAIVTRSQLTAVAFLSCSKNIVLENIQLVDNGNSHRNYSFPAGVSMRMTSTDVTAHYILRGCNISGNNAINSVTHWHYISKKHLHGSSWGGGIGVYFSGNSSGNSVKIENSAITKNMGRWGGGMYLTFRNFTENNTVSVVNSSFHENIALTGGGGVCILYLNDKRLENRTNRVTFYETKLVNNYANYGGGMIIEASYGNKVYMPGGNMNFKHCTLSQNRALYSPAVDVAPYFYKHSINRGFLPIPLFSNVNITENEIWNARGELKKTWKSIAGVFSIMQFTIFFSGKTNFTKNLFSALLLSSSAQVVFEKSSTSIFSHNQGRKGAGIALYSSTLILSENSYLLFTDNIALQYGGGIYYKTTDQHTFITGTSCFIQYIQPDVPPKKRNITLVFRRNFAYSGGSSVYADSFYSCLFSCPDYPRTVDKDIMQCIGNVSLDEETRYHSQLQSSSSKFVFSGNQTEYTVIPGAKSSIPFSIVDQFNKTVTPLMNIVVTACFSRKCVSVLPEYTLNNKFSVYGHPNDNATLQFLTQGIAGVYFLIKVKLLDCPPGFIFNNDSRNCVCSTKSERNPDFYSAITNCNFTTYKAHMKKNYWAGYIPENSTSHENLYFAPCFPPICKVYTYLPNTSKELNSNACFHQRKGVMCGKCIDGHSVYYYSRKFHCRLNHNCNLGPLLYLVSEIVPVCILFSVIVIFDYSFTSGEMVGFIFFSQYLDRLTIHVDKTVEKLRKPYQVFYGIFNFESNLFSFCLWKDFQTLDIIFFKYVTIVVALFLVLALVAFLKSNYCCLRLLKWRAKVTTRTSFVRGLSAFLVMCYSQCTRTSFLILKSTTPIGINDTTIQQYSYYGGLPYLEGRHLIYAIVAIISLILITVLPPLLLLVYPLSLHLLSLCNLSEHWIVNRILKLTAVNRLMPFIDCFQSCYKDKLRFFAGLYFVYRVVILCTYTLFETSYNYRMSSAIFLTLFLGIHALVHPYKNHIHNILDAFVFLNLAIINVVSIYSGHFVSFMSRMNSHLMLLTAIQLILLYLPMTVFLFTAAAKIYLYCKKRACSRDYEMIVEIEQD